MPYTLPELPYSSDALLPHVSPETLAYHHGKHHKTYVEKLNKLVAGTKLGNLKVEDLIRRIDEVDAKNRQKVFNNAAQHFNHSFYWKSLRAPSRSGPSGSFLKAIKKAFGSLDELKAEFAKESVEHFGSGWGWLVKDGVGGLKVVATHDADNPLTSGATPLLTCDVWEHAYYVDYRNDRAAYLDGFWHVANWEFAEENFEG